LTGNASRSLAAAKPRRATPSVAHVPTTEARWRAAGFDAVLAVLSPYEADDGRALGLAVEALGGGEAGLVVLDCMGYRRKVKEEVHALLGVPVGVRRCGVARTG